eukprot:Lankesteria_metandrocarpae@DN728_c0_g1_i1.p1
MPRRGPGGGGGWRGPSMGLRSPPQQSGMMGGVMIGGGGGGMGMGGVMGGVMGGGGGMGRMAGGNMMNSDTGYSAPHDDYGRGSRWDGMRGGPRRPRRGSFRGSRGYGRPRGRGGLDGRPDMRGRSPGYPQGGGGGGQYVE